MIRRFTPLLAFVALAVSACDPADVVPPPAPEAEAPLAGPDLQQAPDFVPGRVLARFQPGAPEAAIAGQQGATLERTMALGIRVLSVPEGAEARVAAALARNPQVEFAEPDLIYTFGDPAVMPVNDPFIGYKWDLDNDGSIYSSTGDILASTGAVDADMDWREAVEALASSNGSARIGITDSGIRNDHEELAGRIAAQFDFFAGDSDAEDDDGHGTHVAGIAAASTDNGTGTAGVAYTGAVDFAIAKVCGRTNPGRFGYGCPTSAIADGIVFVVDNGANVINISLGGGSGSSAQQAALQYARSNGVLPFCAAGNDGGSVSYPAAFPECVAVSATDWGDNLASYSNFGSQVELSAPGGDTEHPDGYSYILSAYNGSSSSYAFMAGTSMASPQAAGLGALLHVLGVTDDGDKLARMKSTADDLGASGTDHQFGAGRINVAAAVAGEGDPPPENQAPTASFTFSCTDLACDFDGTGSSDPDGDVLSYAWDVDGDGTIDYTVVSPSHTYAEAADYQATLTVSDGELDDSQTQTVSVSDGSTADIELTVVGDKVRGVKSAELTWSGATSTNVDIYRDGSLLTTTANDGAHTDEIGRGGGTHTFQVCEAGSTTSCSAEVTVTF